MAKRLNEAIIFATKAHEGQMRKGTNNIPYITHPMKVMTYLMEMNADETLLCAGVLHDTVEDAGVTTEEIETKFGKRVAELVGAHSEDKSLPWKTRKEIDLAELAKGPRDLQMMVLADKLANSSDTLRDYKRIGDKVWDRFNADRYCQKWYYEAGVKALAALKDDPDAGELYQKFSDVVDELFSKVGVGIQAMEMTESELQKRLKDYEMYMRMMEEDKDKPDMDENGEFVINAWEWDGNTWLWEINDKRVWHRTGFRQDLFDDFLKSSLEYYEKNLRRQYFVTDNKRKKNSN